MGELVSGFLSLSTIVGATFLGLALVVFAIAFGCWLFEVISHASWAAYYDREKALKLKRAARVLNPQEPPNA